jgi:hypothetical protein
MIKVACILSSILQREANFLYFPEYVDDDEIVPKNASVILKRVPAKNANTSLMVRLSRGGFSNNLGMCVAVIIVVYVSVLIRWFNYSSLFNTFSSQQKADINVPIKAEPVAPLEDEPVHVVAPKVIEPVKILEDEPLVFHLSIFMMFISCP